MATKYIIVGPLALTALLAVGCRKDPPPGNEDADEPAILAEDGTDTSAAETDAEIVTSSLLSATASGGSLTLASADELRGGNLGPADVGDGAKAIFFPKGCLDVVHDQPTQTVTYRFNGCSGPNGLLRVRGEIKANYRTAPGKLFLSLTGTDLGVNNATVDWSATAEITAQGAAREMRWKGQFAGTTARGRAFSRTNEKVVAWRFGEPCFAVSGVSEGDVRGRSLRTEITDFKRCRNACPEAGGRISITNLRTGMKIEIAFDGTNRATYTGPRGSVQFPLLCRE
jgi:hypothetical protein